MSIEMPMTMTFGVRMVRSASLTALVALMLGSCSQSNNSEIESLIRSTSFQQGKSLNKVLGAKTICVVPPGIIAWWWVHRELPNKKIIEPIDDESEGVWSIVIFRDGSEKVSIVTIDTTVVAMDMYGGDAWLGPADLCGDDVVLREVPGRKVRTLEREGVLRQ